MDLVQKFTNRIDEDSGYDNLSLAQDLVEIAKGYYTKQCNMDSVVGKSEQLCDISQDKETEVVTITYHWHKI